MLKQKCDPGIVTTKETHLQQQQQIKNIAATTTKYIPAQQQNHSGKDIPTKLSKITDKDPGSNSNPVRRANQPFFLINAYKDQNFLKEECELAHALVAKTTKDSGKQSTKSSTTSLPQVKANLPLASYNSTFNRNNNLVSIKPQKKKHV